MSIEALTWAFKQAVRPAGTKFVLVTLANLANEQGQAYPSCAYICRTTGLDAKTVYIALSRLETDGWIEDTGKRKGTTSQIKVFALKGYRNWIGLPENGTENGYLQPENSAVFPGKTPVFPGKVSENGSRIHHESPLTIHENRFGPKNEKTEDEGQRLARAYSEAMTRYGPYDPRTENAKEALRDYRPPASPA